MSNEIEEAPPPVPPDRPRYRDGKRIWSPTAEGIMFNLVLSLSAMSEADALVLDREEPSPHLVEDSKRYKRAYDESMEALVSYIAGLEAECERRTLLAKQAEEGEGDG